MSSPRDILTVSSYRETVLQLERLQEGRGAGKEDFDRRKGGRRRTFEREVSSTRDEGIGRVTRRLTERGKSTNSKEERNGDLHGDQFSKEGETKKAGARTRTRTFARLEKGGGECLHSDTADGGWASDRAARCER